MLSPGGENMASSRAVIALASILMLPLSLGGCAGAIVVGGLAAAGGGYVAGQERGVDGLASDFAIRTDIIKELAETDRKLEARITTTVYNGRVLLTGQVPTPEMKTAVGQIAGRNRYARAVFNEIEVSPEDGVWQDTKDTWISTRVRSEMTVDPDIRGVNYTIETENGSVYLIGSARSQRELERVTEIARRVPGVKRVVSYVELRVGAPVAAGPIAAGPPAPVPLVPGAGADPGLGADRPPTLPRTPIEVEKL